MPSGRAHAPLWKIYGEAQVGCFVGTLGAKELSFAAALECGLLSLCRVQESVTLSTSASTKRWYVQ